RGEAVVSSPSLACWRRASPISGCRLTPSSDLSAADNSPSRFGCGTTTASGWRSTARRERPGSTSWSVLAGRIQANSLASSTVAEPGSAFDGSDGLVAGSLSSRRTASTDRRDARPMAGAARAGTPTNPPIDCRQGGYSMRRCLLWVGLGLVFLLTLALGVWFGFWLAQSVPAPVRAYHRIRLRMTFVEVQNVIGQPPGNYDTIHPRLQGATWLTVSYVRKTGLPPEKLPVGASMPGPGYPGRLTVQTWIWDDYCIWVAFDGAGKTVGYYYPGMKA